MTSVLWVFLFGGIGSVLRYAATLMGVRFIGPEFPWGTLAVNIVGSILIGAFARAFPLPGDGGGDLRLMFMTGLCGGFTTFSAFTLDAANLWLRGDAVQAALYIAGSLVFSLLGVAIGILIGNALSA